MGSGAQTTINTPIAAKLPPLAEEPLTNANLAPLRSAAETNRAWQLHEWQKQLEQGQQLRRQTSGCQAVVALISVLESAAPEELKRPALFELALAAQQENQLARAQQVFAQYVQRFPKDPLVPEVLLRQGILYREMGVNVLALSKFYAVLSSVLSLKTDRFEYYRRLVLQAQTEIADTYFLVGQYEEAVNFLARLLKLDHPDLNKSRIHYKLVRSLASLGRHDETVAQARAFLKRYPQAEEQPEVRFFLATTLKQMGRNHDALQEVLLLLESQRATAAQKPANWNYWQQRTGNEIANQLYREGDYTSALEVYFNLARLDKAPVWQLPVWYQIGLVYERLKQPRKAAETYALIIEHEKDLGSNVTPSLKALLDMARWRVGFIRWEADAEHATSLFESAAPPAKPPLAAPSRQPAGL